MIEAGSLIRSLSGRPAARNFHTFVINEIGHGIVTGRFAVGSILPSDAAMMETYGVSRTVLREALKTLEAKGMVEARPKVGTRVSPTSRWNYFDPQVLSWHFDAKLDRRFLQSLFEVREALEAQAATLAAARRTAEHVRIMKYWVHQMDVAGDGVEEQALSALEIHRAVADSSGNALLRSVTGVVELTIALAITAHTAELGSTYRLHSVQAARDLVAAIERGNVDLAATHMAAAIALDKQQAFEGAGLEWLARSPDTSFR